MKQYLPEDVRRDLLFLRKGVGYTAERLSERWALVAVLGGSIEPEPVLRERLESAIRSLRDLEAELLLDIFGLTPESAGRPDLASRRNLVGKRLGIKREAVADRDAAAIDRLLRQLITGWYPKSPTGIRIPEYHNGFVQHAVHNRTYVRDGLHLETQRAHRLYALFDEVDYVGLSAQAPEPPIVLGPDFTVRTRQTSGGYLHQFIHKTPMRRGQTYELAYRMPAADPKDRGWLIEDSIAFHEPTRFAKFDASFIGQAPRIAWRFQGLTFLERPGLPTRELTLAPAHGSEITAQFEDLYGGLYCGLAWSW